MNWKTLYSLIRQYSEGKISRALFVMDWEREQERMKAAIAGCSGT